MGIIFSDLMSLGTEGGTVADSYGKLTGLG